MKTIEKIKWLNRGIALGKRDCGVCRNLTDGKRGQGAEKRTYCGNCGYYDAFKDMLAEEKRIYAGTADYVEFFENTISALGLKEYIDYRVEDVDGELEIVIGGNV